MPDRVIRISELRDSLSLAYHHVKNTDEPIVVQRYTRQDVALVGAGPPCGNGGS